MISFIPSEILQSIKECIHEEIRGFSFASGGCINNGGQLKTTGGNFFLKWNALQRFPGMFASEAKGLSLIPGYKERFDIYNLYPLLVHLNLFGAGYKSQVVSIVNRFV